ncbi:hypothetical protein CEXT_382711 [Caerostris extrusa]|uniref:Uncharacterized protein n=1 Tax=Caerostris extrusa TaxID=172846 RepID=A0AAV4SD26_CAEEX|nr:hypothetical protein CEXT_382711 [Caerostris extrusa]
MLESDIQKRRGVGSEEDAAEQIGIIKSQSLLLKNKLDSVAIVKKSIGLMFNVHSLHEKQPKSTEGVAQTAALKKMSTRGSSVLIKISGKTRSKVQVQLCTNKTTSKNNARNKNPTLHVKRSSVPDSLWTNVTQTETKVNY